MIEIQQLSAHRKINILITKRVIELQNQGYIYDFGVKSASNLVCLQNNMEFTKQDTKIKLVDLHYNEVTKGFSYIHSVETFSGYNGLMLSDRILCNSNWH